MLDNIPQLIADNPILTLAAGVILRSILAWQSELSWYEYRTLHGLKRMVTSRVPTDTLGPISLINRKRGREDAEYVTTVAGSTRKAVRTLRSEGFSLHLLASLKVRGEGDMSTAQLAYQHSDGTQTEAYIFDNGDNSVDIYCHHETSAGSIRHLTQTNQEPGDPRGVLPWQRD